jgi:hypothetical protein
LTVTQTPPRHVGDAGRKNDEEESLMQWRTHKPAQPCWLITAFVLLFCGFAQAQEFEGAWKLTMRKLANGTTLMPPAVQGAIIGQAGLGSICSRRSSTTQIRC